jgi:hypothetical protein
MDHPFRVVIYNTLGWIALCRAMTEGISPSPEETGTGRKRGSRSKSRRQAGRADFGGNVVPFPRRRPPRRHRKAGPSARSKRSKAEILIFRPPTPA